MRVSENIAEQLTREISSCYQYFSKPEKEKIKRLITKAIAPLEAPVNLTIFDPNSEKSNSHRARILAGLKRAKRKGMTTSELNAVCFRYSARIGELRNQGIKIGCTRLAANSFLYVLSPEWW